MKPFEPAPPAKDMEVRLKHNEFRDLVNELRDTADRYGGTDQLRDQLAHTLARRVRPVPEIVKMRPVLERIDARLACDVLSASSTVEVLKLARDEIMVLAGEVRELRAALQHEADCVEAAKAEVEVLRAELAGLRSSMEFRTSLIGRTEAERDGLRAKVEEMEKQEPVASVWRCDNGHIHGSCERTLPMGAKLYALPGAQNVPKAVAYLDIGAGGYMDIGTDLNDEQLAALPKGRHMLGIVGTYGVNGYVSAQPAPLKAIAKILAEVMDIAAANGADSRSMPDEYVEVAAWLCGVPSAKGEIK